ncbi:GNAT family N-acetyltransferase [Devosia sp. MC532]|uniref:GNAT family N-acetyltransferase n=1 Tax=Devosia sp. MC532 TaxID=2799788 RepID=UPI0018F610CB|nr:GNAT family N-acetyltransferase [Devosia sp. MC532]MBJ7577071.1 GNAT family N-acetyltransferase [Devosia sp. MC532]
MAISASTIRLATADDLAGLAILYRQLHPDDPVLRADTLKANLARFAVMPGSGVFIALVDTQIVATVTVVIVPNLTRGGRPFALLENVVTHADFRKQGFGRHLLSTVVDHAWLADCYKIMLLTGSAKPEVLGFYANCGFANTKTGFEMRRVSKRQE